MNKHRAPSQPVPSLPTPEVSARVAIAAAGLSGNRFVGHALKACGSAIELVAAVWDEDPTLELDAETAHRLRTLGRPALVAAVLDVTAHLGLTVLTPHDECWPHHLDVLGAAAPVVLWVGGDPLILLEPPIAITGDTHPDPELRHEVIDLTTRIADDGWTIATTGRPGVDQLAGRAATVMDGELITVTTTARRSRRANEVVISENPPQLPVVLGSSLRTPILLAGIAGKILIAGGTPGSGAMRTGIAGHALARPLGVFPHGVGRAGEVGLHEQFGTPVVGTLAEVERLI